MHTLNLYSYFAASFKSLPCKTVGKVADTWTILCNVYKTKFLSKSRLHNSTIYILNRVLWPLCTSSVYILTLVQVSNHYLENYRRSCGNTNPTMPCVLDNFPGKSRVSNSPIIIRSEFFDLYAHVQSICLLWCKFQTITLKTVGGVAEMRTLLCHVYDKFSKYIKGK